MFNRGKIEKMGWTLIGQAGVDSGQIMIIDPCYILPGKQYASMIAAREKLGHEKPLPFKHGLVYNTWYGDGNYHIYAMYDKEGRPERIMIDFTTTYGFDEKNPNMHDIDMKDLIKRVWERHGL